MCQFPGKEIYQNIRQALNQAAADWKSNGLDEIRLPAAAVTSKREGHVPDIQRTEKHLAGLQCNDIFQETPSRSDVEPVDMDCADCEPHSPEHMHNDAVPTNNTHDEPQFRVLAPRHGAPEPLACQHKRCRQHVEDVPCHDAPSHKIAHFQAFENEAPFPFLSSQAAEG